MSSIEIIEKPEWVSWEDIQECLFKSHAVNRSKGIFMTHYLWSAERIQESLGKNGKMLVALDGDKLVGTAAIGVKRGKTWFVNGQYAYMCFAGVLPEYAGLGIYKGLTKKREELAKTMGFNVLLLDTHSNNKRIQTIAKKNGYQLVRFFRAKSKDHYSVVMVKWVDKSPFPRYYCYWRYLISKIRTLFSTKVLRRS